MAELGRIKHSKLDVGVVGSGDAFPQLGLLFVSLGKDAGEVDFPVLGGLALHRPLFAEGDVREDLGDWCAAVALLPLLDEGCPDSFLESAFFAQATWGFPHEDGGGPAGRCLQVADEGFGGGADVGQVPGDVGDRLLLVQHHGAVDRAGHVVEL